ncbi:MAG: FprA family A-type flavoprotein [Lachnospiraceae bacterium]|nr:FprA family A-type flavoprotein [Lachnospiraceae bacterium]
MYKEIKKDIRYIGVDDTTLDLFEGQYIIPEGVSYNSYVIMDEKIAIMDTADARKTDEWMKNLDEALEGRTPDYVVVLHMEPDHAGSLKEVLDKYPSMKVVGNTKTFLFMGQFFDMDIEDRKVVVEEGDVLDLGSHQLTFVNAPMVHWPEVMVAYDSESKVLFAADGFGKFGALNDEIILSDISTWSCEARRYYFNIVGKYGAQVQALLKKAAALDIEMICPLHGPVLADDLEFFINKYDTWSSYKPEDKGVLVAYASIHGNTAKAAKKMAELLKEAGEAKVATTDLTRDDMAEAIEDAFRYDRIILAASSYDAGVFTPMDVFLNRLAHKGYRNRTLAIIENGTWAPTAARKMKEIIATMKDINLIEDVITIKSSMSEVNLEQMKGLAQILVDYKN